MGAPWDSAPVALRVALTWASGERRVQRRDWWVLRELISEVCSERCLAHSTAMRAFVYCTEFLFLDRRVPRGMSCKAVLLKLSCAPTSPGELLNNADSDLEGLRWSQRFCVSNKVMQIQLGRGSDFEYGRWKAQITLTRSQPHYEKRPWGSSVYPDHSSKSGLSNLSPCLGKWLWEGGVPQSGQDGGSGPFPLKTWPCLKHKGGT